MIGNDIVDLAQAKQESNWRRARFLDKVFTAHEQQLIHTANDPDGMVWLLWSMKESAYKLIIRQTGKRVFAPQKIACQLTNSYPEAVEGVVSYEGTHYTQSIRTNQYVATVASLGTVFPPKNQVIIPFNDTAYQTQRMGIRNAIKQHCATHFSIPETSIHIHKTESGVPTLRIDDTEGTKLNLLLSISHHGHYGAYVIELSAMEVARE
ncbi:4'-phosphopantetheinyl transferase family protein [Spirosoma jeollabukense]